MAIASRTRNSSQVAVAIIISTNAVPPGALRRGQATAAMPQASSAARIRANAEPGNCQASTLWRSDDCGREQAPGGDEGRSPQGGDRAQPAAAGQRQQVEAAREQYDTGEHGPARAPETG